MSLTHTHDLSSIISVVLVTSPCSSNPDTSIIEQSILSLDKVYGLESSQVIIVMDGFVVRQNARTKRGQITEEMQRNYELYHENLQRLYGNNNRFKIVKSDEHLGFAFCVQLGLSLCQTTYALIAQHDRVFTFRFRKLQDVIDAMEENEHIRYVGFPTSSNRTHDSVLNCRYSLYYLSEKDVMLDIGDGAALHPVIFWFDSQHVCHVKRYLEIYRPYAYLPQELRDYLGLEYIKEMLLRKGDFIEDRLGQMQRRALIRPGASKEIIMKLFRWFGTYLVWIPDESRIGCGNGAYAMVAHLRGRQTDPKKIAMYRDRSRHLWRNKPSSGGTGAEVEEVEEEEEEEEVLGEVQMAAEGGGRREGGESRRVGGRAVIMRGNPSAPVGESSSSMEYYEDERSDNGVDDNDEGDGEGSLLQESNEEGDCEEEGESNHHKDTEEMEDGESIVRGSNHNNTKVTAVGSRGGEMGRGGEGIKAANTTYDTPERAIIERIARRGQCVKQAVEQEELFGDIGSLLDPQGC